ncbi:hypothetical protein QTP70_031845 [Hemibagrus guttatus]|uniref:Endonuclease/exonuclease/phosphatase domain-containing protein n=1 Tax=Hemibagrus guttatus TaxID=175788 RepID=A0AAE0R5Y2_9TELE|nr:hypothetical protein QTP70_031845 [Hemibagrus guttatus]
MHCRLIGVSNLSVVCDCMRGEIIGLTMKATVKIANSTLCTSFLKNKNRGLRPCIDSLILNTIIRHYPYPLPIVPSALANSSGRHLKLEEWYQTQDSQGHPESSNGEATPPSGPTWDLPPVTSPPSLRRGSRRAKLQPSPKVWTNHESRKGARNIERPVGGARSMARQMGGSEEQRRGKWGEARTKDEARRGKWGEREAGARQVRGARGLTARPEGPTRRPPPSAGAEQRPQLSSRAERHPLLNRRAKLRPLPSRSAEQHPLPSTRTKRRTTAPSEDLCPADARNSPKGRWAGARYCRYPPPPNENTNFIPDRSRPGLTTTAIGAVDLQGAGGNWATVGRRSRGGRRVHRQREKRKGKSVGLRIGTLNVGTMTGKGRELADMMERRKVDILCVQETRWKGSKARSIGAGFKLFYYGVDSKRNGVGVVLKEEFVRNVLEVKRVSDRVMSLKLEIEGVMLNVVSGYAPQVGCELKEKEKFWSELDEVMESIPTGERVVIGADFNGHVGEGNTGDEEVMGKFGIKERNLEGQMVVDFAKRMDMAVVNTYFQKREEHRATYKSGGRRTQKLRQALGGQVVLPDDWKTTAEVVRETGRKVLGVSSGRRKEDKETWWWNEEVQDSIQRKRLAKKKWDMDRTEENRQEYKELQRRVKREVSKAKQKAYDELYTRLDTREGQKDLYRLARQRDRDGKDVQQVRVIKDRDGRVLTSEESVQRRWKEYFEELMNEENEREKRVEGVNSVDIS